MSSTFDFVGPVAKITGVNLNATGDNAITLPNGARKFIVRRIIITNASVSLAAGSLQYGIFSGAGGTGETILASGVNSATSLTAASKFISPAVAQDDTITASTLYFRIGTANGTAATADVYLFGDVLP